MLKQQKKYRVPMMAAAALLSATVAPYVIQAEEVVTKSIFEDENVDFLFTTGVDFETPGSTDTYLKAFVTNMNLVIDQNGKAFADITFGGHSYMMESFKNGSAEGSNLEIIKSTGSVETKDLVRTVRVALDEKYQTDVFAISARGNYTFKFDLASEKSKFTLSTGDATLDSYFPAWFPSADVVTAEGKLYAYITMAGHSYGLDQIVLKSGEVAEVVSSKGSAEAKDLVRVVRVALDADNKVAFAIKAGAENAIVNLDFTKKEENSITDLLTSSAKAVSFKYSADVSWHPMAFPSNIVAAAAKKVGNQFELTLQVATEGLKAFEVKQNDKVIATWTPELQIVTVTVNSLEALTFMANKSSDRGDSEMIVKVDEISLNAEGNLPKEANPFTDISNIFSKAEILALYHAGITNGSSASEFNPNATITRAEFAVMVARALGVTSTNETAFVDVKGKWFAGEVQALAELKIINGVNATSFNAAQSISRQDAVTILHRMLLEKGYTNTASAEKVSFTDASKIATTAKEAIAELSAQNILIGYKGNVMPENMLTRAEMAKLLKLSLDLIK